MIRAILILLLVFNFALSATEDPYAEHFRATLPGGEKVDIYGMKPAALVVQERATLLQRWDLFDKVLESRQLAREVLDRIVSAIDLYENQSGHVNANTKPHHDWEMTQLREGRWPVLVVTEAGNMNNVLFRLAIALGHPLPFQRRFYRHLPSGRPARPSLSVLNFPERLRPDQLDDFSAPLIYFDEDREQFVFDELSMVTSKLPWIADAAAEVKFLWLKKGANPNIIRAAHTVLCALGLHRFSTRTIRDRELWKMQQEYLYAPDVYDDIKREITTIRHNLLGQVPNINDWLTINRHFQELEQAIWSPAGLQVFPAVSEIYFQISEKTDETRGALDAAIRRTFRFEDKPEDEFDETVEFGTPGVHTKIYHSTPVLFDSEMAHSLSGNSGILANGIRFRHFSHKRYYENSCAKALLRLLTPKLPYKSYRWRSKSTP